MTGSRAYRGERCMGGQLVYTPDGDVLDKHLYVQRRAPSGFDWGPEADEARIDQLAIALLADSATKNIALDHYKEFAQYLREELEGDEWRLPTSDISTDTWSRDIDVADETPSPEDVDITPVDFDEMTFAVERVLCEKHDISVHQSADNRREELEEARQTVQSETTDTEASETDTERAKREVEAEAVAYVVGRYCGLDTSGSAFYLTAWESDDPEIVRDRLDRISSTVEEFIDVLEYGA